MQKDNRATAPARARFRVLVVDDSAVIRGLIANGLEKDAEVEVVGTAANGQIAVDNLASLDPDVAVLDIEMPVMDGLTALPRLLAIKPDLKVIIASTLTQRGAEIGLRALAAGAAECVAKPMATGLRGGPDFIRDLTEKIKVLARSRRRATAAAPRGLDAPATKVALPAPRPSVVLRPFRAEASHAIAVASSTGGPQALFRLMPALRGLSQPVFITQHMPPTFTTILADHIGKQCGRRTLEARDRMAVEQGCTYIAPGDYHMLVEPTNTGRIIRLSRADPENFCRPAADPMLRSLVACFGHRLLCIVLTGMGRDGLAGCQAAVAAGATVVAQDEATSVIWGMPGAVANAGLCSAVLPLDEIGNWIIGAAQGRPRPASAAP